jgi:signal peptidase I
VALLLTLLGAGLGHMYLGQTRRALAWAGLPALLFSGYLIALVRVPLPALYGSFLAVGLLVFLGVRTAALLDVFLVRVSKFRPTAWLHVGLFFAGTIAYAVVVSLVLRSSVAEAFKIPSGGMQPTLLVGDHLLADKAAFRGRLPARGSLAVFTWPERADHDLLQRVLAVPGDRLELVDGHPWINGWEVPHCVIGVASLGEGSGRLELEFLGDASYLIFLEEGRSTGREGPYAVGPGEVWVVGDNRNNSYDSRAWFGGKGGGVKAADLKGRPLFNWLSFKDDGHMEWSRTGVALAEPRLPPQLQNFTSAFQACLSKRPANTNPPLAEQL